MALHVYTKYFKRYQLPFLTAIACVVLETFCDLLGPTLMSKMINNGIRSGLMSTVAYWGGLMLLVTAIGATFAVIRNSLSSQVSQHMGADLRQDLFEKVMYASESSVDQIESGSLITRLTNDSAQVTQFVNGIMRVFMKAPILGIGSIVLASLLNFKLSLVIYGVVAIVTGLIYLSMSLSYPRFYALQSAVDRLNGKVQEFLIGIRLVKAFGTFDEESEKFDAVNQHLMRKGTDSQMIITLISPFLNLVVGLGTVAVLWFGASLFQVKSAEIGDMAAFIVYMAQILFALIMITNVFNMFVRTKASTQRILEVMNQRLEPPKVELRNDAHSTNGSKSDAPLIEEAACLSFEKVSFAYPGGSGAKALDQISFHIEAGTRLAVIGPTGSGKSTLAWLLMKFYDLSEGRILLGGRSLAALAPNEARSQVVLVPQKPMLFSGSIRENLLWGNENASDEAMFEALSLAEAHFVKDMSDQLESLIGSGGVNLSGGQKQRLSIARALLKPAKILILDDATSALDTVTEARVRGHLQHARPEQTQVIITQRCSTAMAADLILVLEKGKCVGFGTHQSLLASCEVYQGIYQTQVASSKEAVS